MLRVLNSDYSEEVLDYYVRNKDFIMRWEPRKASGFYTLNYQKEQLDNDMQRINEGNMLRLWISKKNEQHRVIGSISFSSIEKGPFLSCYLGYKLDKDEINQGFMTEAVKRATGIIFKEHKLHRIEANIMPENKASIKVVEKLDFHYEGTALKYLKINGKWEDHIHMVLLNNRMR